MGNGAAARPAAEVLEDRTLLSATFSVDGNSVRLDEFTQVAAEKLAVRENGTNYEFVLSEGTWNGTAVDGISGAGTAILSVEKAAVAGLTGGIVIDTSIVSTLVRADATFGTADLSTLSGGLHVTAGAVTQTDGNVLTVSALDVHAITIDVRGDIIGDAGNLLLEAATSASFVGASISTTSGEIRLKANVSTLTAAAGAFDGLTIRGTSLTSDDNAVWLSGRSGSSASRNFAGVRLGSLSELDPAANLTTIDARGVSIVGRGLAGGSGVVMTGTSIESIGISINGNGWRGVEIGQFSSIASTWTGVKLGGVSISGQSTDKKSGVGVLIAPEVQGDVQGPLPSGPTIRSVNGNIRIASANSPRDQSVGVIISFATIETTGTGPDAGLITIVAGGRHSGVEIYGGTTSATSVRTIDGGIGITGAATFPVPEFGFDDTVGVRLNGQVESTGPGRILISGKSFDNVGSSIEIGVGHTLGYSSEGGGVTTGGDIQLLGTVEIGSFGYLIAPAGTVSIANAYVGLASTQTDGLSNEELGRIEAKVLRIGARSGGIVVVEGAVEPPATDRIGTLLITAGTLTDQGIGANGKPLPLGRLDVDRLVVMADSVNLQNASVGSLTADVKHDLHVENEGDLILGSLSAERIFIDVAGTVTIAPGATLNVARFEFSATPFYPDPPAEPLAQGPFLIRNDGSDPIVGMFANLPEGTLIANVANHPVRITYKANKPDGMNDAAIELHVEPFAKDDAYTIPENVGTLFKNVLTNDIDYGSGPLAVTAVNGVAGATGKNLTLGSGANLWVDPDGYFYYTPGDAFADLAADEEATDIFTYRVTDTHGGKWTARVRITITGEGSADLIGYNSGGWYVGVSDGDSFTTTAWAGWSDVAWDALQSGDFNGDGLTDVLGLLDGYWFVGTSTGTSFQTALWTQWANAAWQDVLVADLDLDGDDDILARVGGNWWGALSNGSSFDAPTLWAAWADVPWDEFAIGTSYFAGANAPGTPTLFGFIDGAWWAAAVDRQYGGFMAPSNWATLPNADYDAVRLLDYDGDHASDFAVLRDGTWTIGTPRSSQGPFGNFQTLQWADTDWQDIRIGDFDGDGQDDILARAGGAWWVAQFKNGGFVTTLWDVWSNLDWQDVTVADFDGDGTDDIAARYAGAWWVGTSTGSAFFTTHWDTWTPGGWSTVLAGDVNGVPAPMPSSGSPGSVTTTGVTLTRGGTFTTTGGFFTSVQVLDPIDLSQPVTVVTFLPDSDSGGTSTTASTEEPEVCEDYPYLNDDASSSSANAPTDPEICIDYPFLGNDGLLDELLMTA